MDNLVDLKKERKRLKRDKQQPKPSWKHKLATGIQIALFLVFCAWFLRNFGLI